ncbi:hypothetical protein NE237_026019 [Protea cynaroides]|uniref:Uncharacterized protein n=1 Tax=Protea cynaroides TaxID=273540 RepID=A0A9Q0K2B1_9MAGN|nr:hypothetical protein NE237_026019 [Protea cynaroides]
MREDEVPLLEEGSEGSVIQRIWVESKKIWQIAGPAIFSRVVLYAMTLIIQAFAGHLGNLDLAAISIAFTVIISISFGFLRICLVGYGKHVGEEFIFIMSRILAGFDIDTDRNHDGSQVPKMRGSAISHMLSLPRLKSEGMVAIAGIGPGGALCQTYCADASDVFFDSFDYFVLTTQSAPYLVFKGNAKFCLVLSHCPIFCPK